LYIDAFVYNEGEFALPLSRWPCKAVGYAVYYLGVSMFCWMSALCFDLSWTFARARVPRKGSDGAKL